MTTKMKTTSKMERNKKREDILRDEEYLKKENNLKNWLSSGRLCHHYFFFIPTVFSQKIFQAKEMTYTGQTMIANSVFNVEWCCQGGSNYNTVCLICI